MVRVVKSTEQPQGDAVVNVPGNYYDKHGSKNPIVRWLMRQFHEKLDTATKETGARKILDVGCGEGHTTAQLKQATGATMTGVDLEESVVKQAKKNYPKITFKTSSAYKLPFKARTFPLVVSTEVLEHLESPARAAKELKRVSSRWVIVTVPNEPWWRIGNMARGAYLKDLGNTPGHVNHWTRRGFKKFLRQHFSDVKIVGAVMWTIAVCKR